MVARLVTGALFAVAGLATLAVPAHAADPAEITVTATDATMAYGADAPPVSPSYAGFPVGSDASDLAVPPTCSADVAAGTTTCTGAQDPRYTFSYLPGALTVTPAPLTITASDVTWVDDDTSEQPVPEYDGLVAGDLAPATPPTCSADPGTHTTSCAGAADPHYAISYRTGLLRVVQLAPAPVVDLGAAPVADGVGSPSHGPRASAVAPPVAVLPNTGNPANPLLAALGALLVACGALLVRRSRRA